MATEHPDELIEYVPSFPLYRRAAAMATQAEKRAAQYAATGNRERLFREVDATIETIVLTQAAAEGYVYAVLRRAGVTCGGSWREKWSKAPAAVSGPDVRALNETTTDTLAWLSAWRNYLVHDDDRARSNLIPFAGADEPQLQLRAEMARLVISRMDDAFCDLGSLVGHRTLAAPHSTGLWISSDEA